jgi:hypothetical protein
MVCVKHYQATYHLATTYQQAVLSIDEFIARSPIYTTGHERIAVVLVAPSRWELFNNLHIPVASLELFAITLTLQRLYIAGHDVGGRWECAPYLSQLVAWLYDLVIWGEPDHRGEEQQENTETRGTTEEGNRVHMQDMWRANPTQPIVQGGC